MIHWKKKFAKRKKVTFKKEILTVASIAAILISGVYATSCFAKETTARHNTEWIETEAATCCRNGEEEKICKNCGRKFLKRKTEKTDHEYKNCKCIHCGMKTTIDKESHTIILTKEIYKELGLDTEGYVEIPETVWYNEGEYQVVGLGNELFNENGSLTAVYVPDGVWFIGSFAFNNCTNLKEVSLPDSVSYIGKAAFQLCSSLEHLNLPKDLEIIGGFGYNHCSGIQDTAVYIGDKVKRIGDDVEAPAHMFYDFGQDENFKEFEVSEETSCYMDEEGILYTKDQSVLVSIPRGKEFNDNTYIMPDTVTVLGELSFSRNQNIEKVVLSDNLTVNSELSITERRNYNNHGNDLSRATYIYSSVKEYMVKETNKKYFTENGILYSKDGKTLVAIPNHYNKPLVIPEGVERWEQQALWSDAKYFKGIILNEIPSIAIPATLTEMDEQQVKTVNFLAASYGTKITVADGNLNFFVGEDGMLYQK